MPDRGKNINKLTRYLLPVLLLLTGKILAQQNTFIPFSAKTIEKKLEGLTEKQQVHLLDSVSLVYAQHTPEEGLQATDFAIGYLLKHEKGKKEIPKFYLRRAQQYRKVRKYALALNDLLRAEEIFLKQKDVSGVQQVSMAYANLYMQARQNVKAIKYALRAIQYAEQLKEDESIGVACNTLATLYKDQKMPDSAMFYYRKSLYLLEKKKDPVQQALLLDNISMLWSELNQLDSAKQYNNKALEMAYQSKNAFLELQLLLNTTGLFEKQKLYDQQYTVALRATRLADSLHDDVYQVYTSLNLGSSLINLKRPAEAIRIFRPGIKPLLYFGDNVALSALYEEMGRAFEHMGRYDSALHYYQLNKAVKDSVEKTSARDEVNELLAQNQLMAREQKIEHLNQLNKTSEEKNLALKEKNTLKSAIIWVSAALLVVIVVLLVITFKRYRDNRKLATLLEHKNTEITDSINYAQRIQFALLPDEKELRQLLPNSFIVFKPKDIVSGDFYWVAQKNNLTFVAVGDCTGHGVPGGFMSMLGHGFLNDIIIDKHIHDPGKILDVLREKVIRALKQTGATGENKDGMDISLVVLNPANGWFTYAAANNPLYLVHQGQLTELGADKQPIGFYQQNMLPFTSRQVRYTPGDQLYLFTDGYADQFGGPKGKKLLYKRMKEQVVAASGLKAAEQHQTLEEQFNAWKGAYEQVDDVCVMGLRLS